jgi:peptide/nickel transport system permease protein
VDDLAPRRRRDPTPSARASEVQPDMIRFFVSRIAQTVAVLFTVSVIIFALMRMIPGDPVLMMLGDDFSQDAYKRLQSKLGLDRSIVVQYMIWLGNILRGDFGDSYLNQEPVWRLVWDAFQPTLVLVVASLIVGVLIALPSGIVAAMKKNSAWDWGSMGFAIFVYSMPGFWKGIVLIWIFSVYLGWFPAVGYVAPWDDFWRSMWRLVLPAITLGTFFSGLVARIVRSSLLEVLDQDYIKAARARGVRQASLVYRHGLANALIPVVTVIGLQFGALLGGAVLTETVFGIPGMGRLTVAAILNRDYAVVQGAILVGVFAVVLVNLAVDLTYAFLNPRIRVA